MTQSPLATICIPLFNKGQHIAKTLETVLAQTYPHLEIVVSDNGSNDGSTEIAREFARRDARVKYHRLQHRVSMNESFRYCYQLAQGEFVNLHSADDTSLPPQFLERMIEPLRRRPEIGFTVCEVEPHIGHTMPGMTGDVLINCFRGIAARCRDLANTPDRDQRARKLLVYAALENGLGSNFAAVLRRECLPYSHWKKTTYSWAESYPDWDFMIRLFLDHQCEFVEGIKFQFHFDAGAPYWRTHVDNRVELYDKMWRVLMPFTILCDPEMADVRLNARPDELNLLLQHLQQRVTLLTEVADHVAAFDRPQLTAHLLPKLTQIAESFRRNPNDLGTVVRFRQLRNGLVRHWLATPTDTIPQQYAGPHGQAQRLLLEGGVRRLTLDEYEHDLTREAAKQLAENAAAPTGPLLALMLLTDANRVQGFHAGLVPDWLQADWQRLAG